MAFRVSAFKIRQVILCRSIGEGIGLSAQAVFGERGSTLKCVQVIKLQDNTMVQALVLIYAAVSVLGLLFGDILMAMVDPRISFTGKEGAR